MRLRLSTRHDSGSRCRGPLLALATLAAALSTPDAARAQSEQLYFVGMEGRMASLSAEGGASTGVYLRWDPVEGEVPGDVQFFVIKRDGQQLKKLPAHDLLPAGEIATLYQGAEQSRRRAEMLSSLDRNASGQRTQA